MQNTVRIPAAPHVLLNPNRTVTKKERKKLPWPLPVKSVYMIKSILKAQYQDEAIAAAERVKGRVAIKGPVVLEVLIAYGKGRQIPDFDNAISMLKGAIDGVVKAGFMYDDDQVIGIYLDQIKDPDKLGYTVITVREAKRSELREEWRLRMVKET